MHANWFVLKLWQPFKIMTSKRIGEVSFLFQNKCDVKCVVLFIFKRSYNSQATELRISIKFKIACYDTTFIDHEPANRLPLYLTNDIQ